MSLMFRKIGEEEVFVTKRGQSLVRRLKSVTDERINSPFSMK